MKLFILILLVNINFALAFDNQNSTINESRAKITIKKILDIPENPSMVDSNEVKQYYVIQHDSATCIDIKVDIYTESGILINSLTNVSEKGRQKEIIWDVDDINGKPVKSDKYIFVTTVGEATVSSDEIFVTN